MDPRRSARGHVALSGIGPRFHGLWQEPSTGITYSVTDAVPGDFVGAHQGSFNSRVSSQTFHDLESMLGRLQQAGKVLPDFQYFLSSEGRLMAIDAERVATYRDETSVATTTHPSFTEQRTALLLEAPPDVGRAYIDDLRQTNPAEWRNVIDRLGAMRSGKDRLLTSTIDERFGAQLAAAQAAPSGDADPVADLP